MADCYNCGQPAQHEAEFVGSLKRIWRSTEPRWLPYCCTCFDHDWSQQRLIDGQQCGKVPVTRQGLPAHEWQWRKEAGSG